MILEPLHTIEEPSAFRRQTSSSEEALGTGKTDTEAPESTKNSLSDRISFRKMREEQQISSGTEARGGAGAEEGLAGWMGVSTCLTASFPTWNTVSCSGLPCLHASYRTNRPRRSRGSGGLSCVLWIVGTVEEYAYSTYQTTTLVSR